jgi:hypothetical protein
MTFGRYVSLVTTALLSAFLLPSCSRTANVNEVWMSPDGDGTRRRNEFFTDTKEIHCIAKAGIGRDNVTIEGFIRAQQLYDFAANRYVNVDAVVAYAEFHPQPVEGQAAIFDLVMTPRDPRKPPAANSQDAPYFPGRYTCEMLLDGALEGSAVFNVGFPPCPPATIVPGDLCVGFYRENDQCPAYGASAQPDPKCTCTQAGWKC